MVEIDTDRLIRHTFQTRLEAEQKQVVAFQEAFSRNKAARVALGRHNVGSASPLGALGNIADRFACLGSGWHRLDSHLMDLQ
ncbi:hypothetical protein D3C81_2076670 [compost metagenome]